MFGLFEPERNKKVDEFYRLVFKIFSDWMNGLKVDLKLEKLRSLVSADSVVNTLKRDSK